MEWFEDPQWNRRWVAKWDKGIDKGIDRALTRGLKKSVVVSLPFLDATNATNTTNDNPESKGNQVPKVRGTIWSCCTFKSFGS